MYLRLFLKVLYSLYHVKDTKDAPFMILRQQRGQVFISQNVLSGNGVIYHIHEQPCVFQMIRNVKTA